MYCIECGTQIPKNSKFCPHCGKSQIDGYINLNEKVNEVIIEKETRKQVIEEHKTSFDYEFLKKSMAFYLAWILLHLGLLLIGSDGIFNSDNMGSDNFYPFDGGDCKYCQPYLGNYDITEFLVYTIFPLALLIIWSMLQKRKI